MKAVFYALVTIITEAIVETLLSEKGKQFVLDCYDYIVSTIQEAVLGFYNYVINLLDINDNYKSPSSSFGYSIH
jgi:hypothetical protein